MKPSYLTDCDSQLGNVGFIWPGADLVGKVPHPVAKDGGVMVAEASGTQHYPEVLGRDARSSWKSPEALL